MLIYKCFVIGRKDTNKHIKEKESSENNVYEVMHQKMPQEDSFKVGSYLL